MGEIRTITANQRRQAYQKHLSGTHIININFPPTLPENPPPPSHRSEGKTFPHTKQNGNEFPHKIRVQRMSPALFLHLLCAATINLAFILTFLPSCPVPVLSAPLSFFGIATPPDNIVGRPCPSATKFSCKMQHERRKKLCHSLKIENSTPKKKKKIKKKTEVHKKLGVCSGVWQYK